MTASTALDDVTLAERIRSGDRQALGELYDRNAPLALATAVIVVSDRALAEDVVHDSFVAAWQRIDRFDRTEGSFRYWLIAIVRSRAIDGVHGGRPAIELVEDGSPARPKAARILVIDDDRDIGAVVTAILADEGYEVATLDEISDEAVRAAIDRIEPDCILLDGARATEYAEAWATAAEVRTRSRPIPMVMFTAHATDAAEASRATSQRAADAGFSAVLRKPFNLEELVSAVERAVAQAVPFDPPNRDAGVRADNSL